MLLTLSLHISSCSVPNASESIARFSVFSIDRPNGIVLYVPLCLLLFDLAEQVKKVKVKVYGVTIATYAASAALPSQTEPTYSLLAAT